MEFRVGLPRGKTSIRVKTQSAKGQISLYSTLQHSNTPTLQSSTTLHIYLYAVAKPYHMEGLLHRALLA